MMIEDPLPSFRFIVTLLPGDAYLPPSQAALLPLVGSEFTEVKGLGADLEVTAYPEGGVNDHVHQLPVRHSWSRGFRFGAASSAMADSGRGTWLDYTIARRASRRLSHPAHRRRHAHDELDFSRRPRSQVGRARIERDAERRCDRSTRNRP